MALMALMAQLLSIVDKIVEHCQLCSSSLSDRTLWFLLAETINHMKSNGDDDDDDHHHHHADD
eukprot:8702818-Karenia_brevis.AAC.1